MRKTRKTIFLIFISLFLIFGFLLTLFLLINIIQNFPSTNNTPPVVIDPDNKPDDKPTDPIDIGNKEVIDYFFGAINSDGTISIFEREGKDLTVELDNSSWQDLRFSPDNNYLSVLGLNESVLNIFLYDLKAKEGTWITDFSSENDQAGVSSYTWKDNKNIYYMQGITNNSWLHKYNIDTKQERLKIIQTKGDIFENLEPNYEGIILKEENDFLLVSEDGAEIINITDIIDSEVGEINFIDEDTIIFSNKDEFSDINYYEYSFTKKNVEETTELNNLEIFCFIDSKFLNYIK